MFQHETLENLSHQVKIQDMEPEVFQEMLRFIYTGRMSPLKIKKADD
jgi:speckle-type POZ protein